MASSTSDIPSSIASQSDTLSSVSLQARRVLHLKQAAQAGIFMSYAQADELFAAELAESLRTAGLPVWLDIFDITVDGDWRTEVENALNRCGVMVAILSPNMRVDEEIWREQSHFTEQHKAIIPVIYQPGCRIAQEFAIEAVDFSKNYRQGLSILLRLLA